MIYRLFASALLSLVVISAVGLPFQSHAQEVVGQEEYYRWLQSKNRTLRRSVGRLDDKPVQSFPIPILFGLSPSTISPNFGDPRSGGRTHEGQDLMAPKGAPIISPTDAVVLETGTWTGAGKYVSTANPGGEKFVYMHLDWIADLDTGDVLKPGDLIGYVGNTGNASGGAPHLHFEVRKNGATDPFPRLTVEFSLAQKMEFVEEVIDDARDAGDMVDFLVANYRSQFLAAQASGLDIPSSIEREMQRTAASGGPAAASFPGDLTLGSRGSEVIMLQNFLIAQNKGPAARALAGAGATGNFGPITQSALIEYQSAVGIAPADGYYGPLTRAYAQANPAPTAVASMPAQPTASPVVPVATIASAVLVPTRDLTLGSTGADVTWLQAFLITANSGPASLALGKSGATGYFGAVTQTALAEYQAKAGMSPATGYFGAVTRAYLTSALRTN